MTQTSSITPSLLASSSRILDIQSQNKRTAWLIRADGETTLFLIDQKGNRHTVKTTNTNFNIGGSILYGGGEFSLHDNFIIAATQQGSLIRIDIPSMRFQPITPMFGRVSSPTISPCGRWVAYIHSDGERDTIAIVDTAGKTWPQKISSEFDFYMQPSWHPDSHTLAWISWDNPFMPWSESKLVLASFEENSLKGGKNPLPVVEKVGVAYHSPSISLQQPQFSPDGKKLAFISDEAKFSHLHYVDFHRETLHYTVSEQVTTGSAEHCTPAFVQGLRHYQWLPDSQHLLVIENENAIQKIALVDTDSAEKQILSVDGITEISQLSVDSYVSDSHDAVRFAFIASGPKSPPAPYDALLQLSKSKLVFDYRPLTSTHIDDLNPNDLVLPQHCTWTHNDATCHGVLYRPTVASPLGATFPAIILVHGGPTAQAHIGWNLKAQYFASRGWVVLDLNFRGSTGYGRVYMDAMNGRWGESDTEDILSAAEFLIREFDVNPNDIVVMGGSSGGYAVLHALAAHPGRFAAGVALYPVTDHLKLAQDTHKFERYYNDQLIGPMSDHEDRYRELSPITRAASIVDPLVIFHGTEDPVIPVDHVRDFVDALSSHNRDVIWYEFEGEGHGWRREATVEKFYQNLNEFLSRYVISKV